MTRVAKRYKRRAARSNRCQERSDLVTPDNAGGIVDFSGTTGPNNDSKITAGSIEGAEWPKLQRQRADCCRGFGSWAEGPG